MKKIILIFGAISGAIIIGSIMLSLSLSGATAETIQVQEWIGYLVMVVAFSVIFVGIKRYRDQNLGGVINFKTATLLGLGITLVASIIYVVAWEINLSVTDYSFISEYTESIVKAKEAEGVSDTALQEIKQDMEDFKVQYANPFFRLPVTFIEIFPVGLLITLISAGVLRNSNVFPAKVG